jgi:hypothetical protein
VIANAVNAIAEGDAEVSTACIEAVNHARPEGALILTTVHAAKALGAKLASIWWVCGRNGRSFAQAVREIVATGSMMRQDATPFFAADQGGPR